jgi:glutaredoxin-like protein NrdH
VFNTKYASGFPISILKGTNKMVTVYTLPSCVQCESTKKYLTNRDVAYEIVDLSTDPAAMDRVKALGYQAAPVVIAGDDHWSGFRPDKLGALSNN